MSARSRTADTPTLSRRPRGTTKPPQPKPRREEYRPAAVLPFLRRCPARHRNQRLIRSLRRAYQSTRSAQLAERLEFPSRSRVVRPPTDLYPVFFEPLPRCSQSLLPFRSRDARGRPFPRGRRHLDAARREPRRCRRVAPALSETGPREPRPARATACAAAAGRSRSTGIVWSSRTRSEASPWRLVQSHSGGNRPAARHPVRAKRRLASRLAPVSGLSERHRRDGHLPRRRIQVRLHGGPDEVDKRNGALAGFLADVRTPGSEKRRRMLPAGPRGGAGRVRGLREPPQSLHRDDPSQLVGALLPGAPGRDQRKPGPGNSISPHLPSGTSTLPAGRHRA